ncbi:MAG TPA: DNA primase [Gammaproteobacteria bacterium]|nr:DNA primase [Gammaproteobacteria bacterium]
MTAADTLLARLDRVKSTGPDAWIASCPAHEDRRPSLSIRQVEDRVLIHCWAGCGALDVVGAVGLELRDLFERRHTDSYVAPRRPPLPSSRELVALLEFDLAVFDCAAGKLFSNATEFTPADRETLFNAIADVRRVLDYCHAYR